MREDIEVKQIMSNYMLDAITTCGYGVDTNTLMNPDNKFVKMVLCNIYLTFCIRLHILYH